MSDELNLMLLAIKNYAKSEFDSMSNNEDTEIVNGLRKWVEGEIKEYQTLHIGLPDLHSPQYNQKIGYFRCLNTLERALRKTPTP